MSHERMSIRRNGNACLDERRLRENIKFGEISSEQYGDNLMENISSCSNSHGVKKRCRYEIKSKYQCKLIHAYRRKQIMLMDRINELENEQEQVHAIMDTNNDVYYDSKSEYIQG